MERVEEVQRENVLLVGWSALSVGYRAIMGKRSRVCWVAVVDVRKMGEGQWKIVTFGCWKAFLDVRSRSCLVGQGGRCEEAWQGEERKMGFLMGLWKIRPSDQEEK